MQYISVIVPFRNSESYIAECINGLLSQSYPSENFEIIMVDNNSTDGSRDIVKQFPRIKQLSEKKQGSYAARNRGLKAAKGEIIAFTDSDCVPYDNWLNEIAHRMGDSEVGIVIGSHEFAKKTISLSLMEAYENEKKRYVLNSKIKKLYYGHTNNMAVRRHLFDQIGPFIERKRGSDTVFVRQSVESYSCDVVRYCSEMRVRHLEIKNPINLYRKYYIYAYSRRKYRHMAEVSELSNSERYHVFLRTVQNQHYAIMKSTLLFALLTAGLIFWGSGRISATLSAQKEGINSKSLKDEGQL